LALDILRNHVIYKYTYMPIEKEDIFLLPLFFTYF